MPIVYRFNGEGEFIGIDFVDDNYEPGELEAVVPDGEEINFHKFALRDGQLVEGLTPEEITELENPIGVLPTRMELLEAQTLENRFDIVMIQMGLF